MSDCAQLKENYEAYALGALDPGERAEIEAHLARRCPTCLAGIERARWLVSQLTYLAPEAQPSPQLRNRILRAAEPAPLRAPVRRAAVPVWAWAGAVAALVLFSVFSARQVGELRFENATLAAALEGERARIASLTRERQQYEKVLEIVSSAGTRGFVLKATQDQPVIQAYWHETLGLVLAAQKMPQVPEDRTLQLWVVPKKGAPISAGIFRPDAAGAVLHINVPPATVAEAAALAITNEPAGGRPTPTLPPIWAAPVESK